MYIHVFILLMENFPIYLTCPLFPSVPFVPLSLSSFFFCSVHKMQFPINVTEFFLHRIFLLLFNSHLINAFFLHFLTSSFKMENDDFTLCKHFIQIKKKIVNIFQCHEKNRDQKDFVCVLEVHFFIFL